MVINITEQKQKNSFRNGNVKQLVINWTVRMIIINVFVELLR
jgi:hypothetical protein